jgi:pimeloyl-ACP methyl ester carboxylesterase
MVAAWPVRYARIGDARVAYRVMGEGPLEIASVGGVASHLDLQAEEPVLSGARQRLASFARVVTFDRRGTGLSDPLDRPSTLEQQMDDLGAVLEAVGMERVALFGAVEAGLCAMYAATHPERVTAMVLANVAVSGGIVRDAAQRALALEWVQSHWGEGRFAALFAPSRTGDRWFMDWWGAI